VAAPPPLIKVNMNVRNAATIVIGVRGLRKEDSRERKSEGAGDAATTPSPTSRMENAMRICSECNAPVYWDGKDQCYRHASCPDYGSPLADGSAWCSQYGCPVKETKLREETK